MMPVSATACQRLAIRKAAASSWKGKCQTEAILRTVADQTWAAVARRRSKFVLRMQADAEVPSFLVLDYPKVRKR